MSIGQIERLYTTYRDRADLYVVYIREAHPTDGRQVPANVRDGILVRDPRTFEERARVAKEFAAQFRLSLPILVDTLDDAAERAFAGWPDRIYVIDGAGKIAYKGEPGPRGFLVGEAEQALARVLERSPTLPATLRERLAASLAGLGLTPAELGAAEEALARRLAAFRPVAEARRKLSAVDEAGVPAALEAYRAAVEAQTRTVEQVDARLEQALRLGARPLIRARLTALGLLGVSAADPAAPFEAAPGRTNERE